MPSTPSGSAPWSAPWVGTPEPGNSTRSRAHSSTTLGRRPNFPASGSDFRHYSVTDAVLNPHWTAAAARHGGLSGENTDPGETKWDLATLLCGRRTVCPYGEWRGRWERGWPASS